MYIGVISDTHGVWSPEFKTFLEPVDEIWHAGDWGGSLKFAQKISNWKKTIGVYGNCDGQDIRFEYPAFQNFVCEGMNVLMTHIGGYPGKYDIKALRLIEQFRPNLFVCGHSHILKVQYDNHFDMLTINPGACGLQGWQIVRTALRFKINNATISDMEVYELNRR